MIGGDAKQRKKKSGGNSITGGSAVSHTRHNLGNSHILCNTKVMAVMFSQFDDGGLKVL